MFVKSLVVSGEMPTFANVNLLLNLNKMLMESNNFAAMKRRIVAYKNYYKDFFESLDAGTQEKILYGMLLLKTQERLPSKFVKSIRDGLYELRIEWQGNIYRIFFCFDQGQVVVLFNCFQKKSQKTPQKEINKALKLKAESCYGRGTC